MRSVADILREETQAAVLRMTPAERVALALALGDDDLDLFMRSTGLSRTEAQRRLAAARHHGRVPSCAGRQFSS